MDTLTGAESITSANDTKKPHRRSAAYPSYTLDSSILFTEKVDKAFSNVAFTPQDAISKAIDQSGGAFLMQLSSAVQYGLLEKSSGEGYKPTDLFKKIHKPLPTENVADSKLECFTNPKLYKVLIELYKDKQLPSEVGLSNTLERNHGVLGNAATTAAKIFYKNLDSLKLLTNDNILKIDTYIPFVEESQETDPHTEDRTALLLPPAAIDKGQTPPAPPSGKVREIPIFLAGGRDAKVILPMDFDDEDVKRIAKVLGAYLP